MRNSKLAQFADQAEQTHSTDLHDNDTPIWEMKAIIFGDTSSVLRDKSGITDAKPDLRATKSNFYKDSAHSSASKLAYLRIRARFQLYTFQESQNSDSIHE
mmetsp:Transcript_61604/g.70637  ORF Transcript_61604/g.70637 Transcript_61604/m.70637 type:complete len:101 (-) Transcript_61604:465-767(-)